MDERPALRAAVHHQDKTVRLIAVTCLGEMGPDAAAAIPDLIELLDDRRFKIWLWGAYALGEIGPAAEGAVPALSKLIDDEDADTRQVAREALQKIRRDRGSSEDE